MAIEFPCPFCTARIRVPDNAGGGKGQCPKCSKRIVVPKHSTPLKEPAKTAAKADDGENPFANLAPVAGTAPPPATPFDEPAPVPAATDDPFGFGGEPEATTTSSAPRATVGKGTRKKPVPWGLVIGISLAVIGLIAGGVVLQTFLSERLTGTLTAESPDGIELPARLLEKEMLGLSDEEAAVVLSKLEKSPVNFSSDRMKVQFSGSNRGMLISVQPGSFVRFYRIKLQGERKLEQFRKRMTATFEEERTQELEKVVAAFANEYKQVRAKKAQGEGMGTYRDSLGLRALTAGLGHEAMALYEGTLYPCVYEDVHGDLYYLLPKNVEEFELVGREYGKNQFHFPAQYKVNVTSRSKATKKPKAESDTGDTKETDKSESEKITPDKSSEPEPTDGDGKMKKEASSEK